MADMKANPKHAGVPVFATLTQDQEFISRLTDAEWKYVGELMPKDWSNAHRDELMKAIHGTCWLLQNRHPISRYDLSEALGHIKTHCSQLRAAINAVPMAVWISGDARAAGLDAENADTGDAVACNGLESVLQLGVENPTPMGDPMLFPSDLVQAIVPQLERLERNASDELERLPAPDKGARNIDDARRFAVGRIADAIEQIKGKPLPKTAPDWFVELMQQLSPALGFSDVKIGKTVVNGALKDRRTS